MNATTGLALLILITLPVTALGDLVPADHPFFEYDQVQEIRLYFEQVDFDVFTPFQGNLNNQQTVTLDTSILASGVYILRLSQGQSVISTLVTVIK